MHSIVADGPVGLLLRGDSRLQFVGYPLMAIGLVIVGFGVAALSTGFGAFLVRALVGVVVAGVGYVLVDQATTPVIFDRVQDPSQRGNPAAAEGRSRPNKSTSVDPGSRFFTATDLEEH